MSIFFILCFMFLFTVEYIEILNLKKQSEHFLKVDKALENKIEENKQASERQLDACLDIIINKRWE